MPRWFDLQVPVIGDTAGRTLFRLPAAHLSSPGKVCLSSPCLMGSVIFLRMFILDISPSSDVCRYFLPSVWVFSF